MRMPTADLLKFYAGFLEIEGGSRAAPYEDERREEEEIREEKAARERVQQRKRENKKRMKES